MDTQLPELEQKVRDLISGSELNQALAEIVVGIHNTYKTPAFAHRHLYYSELDRLVQGMADTLSGLEQSPAPTASAQAPKTPESTLILATELHQVGGHSRVVKDLADQVVNPTIVLTDVFWLFHRLPHHQAWIPAHYDRARVLVLRETTVLGKCRELVSLVEELAPTRIWYFLHHEDPVGLVGTLNHRPSAKVFAHHADHHPSLGNTLPGLTHVDFTDELAARCRVSLSRTTHVLPLFVPDGGKKTFRECDIGAYSVVTSGTQLKFARTGEFALKNVVSTVLTETAGKFFHIGPLDEDWRQDIASHLGDCGIDPARFVFLGQVPSLWDALRSVDAHIYLSSVPVAGGRATSEAQGAGFPVVYFGGHADDSALAVDSIYADDSLGWSALHELPGLCRRVAGAHATFSEAARAHYDANNSRACFQDAISRIEDAAATQRNQARDETPAIRAGR